MHSVHFDFTIDTVFILVAWNVIGTALQVLLNYIHDKKKWTWSDGPLKTINFLMTMTAVLIANKSKPIDKPEFNDKPKT